jgi:hypothetical protein
MTPEILEWAKGVRQRFPFKSGRVLEVGSYNVNGTIRDVFPDATEYIGIDQREGPCVDLVAHGREVEIRFGAASFDTVVCCETLEHDPAFWLTVNAMRNALVRGGYMMVTTPSINFPIHRFPLDCYRFAEDAYREFIFHDLEILDLSFVGDNKDIICCLGRK